ncbi:hypothetical protein M0811_02871 [Anaeramoeba ignava]|uniref:Uncharacterized protein n=1 Tax=Anaeramoeba ignava TaxID=1746090 RepID=A0A9Q0L7U2_ANAIG|nr:hypothetical protein M0811_02871 [Anaeramoeba ignava]
MDKQDFTSNLKQIVFKVLENIKTFIFSIDWKQILQTILKSNPLHQIHVLLCLLLFISIIFGSWFNSSLILIGSSLFLFYFEVVDGYDPKKLKEMQKKYHFLKYVVVGFSFWPVFIFDHEGKYFWRAFKNSTISSVLLYSLAWRVYAIYQNSFDEIWNRAKKSIKRK